MQDKENSTVSNPTENKDKSTFTVVVKYQDEDFEDKEVTIKFNKRYKGKMLILDSAISKINAGQMLAGLRMLAQNAYVSKTAGFSEKQRQEEANLLFANEEIVFALIAFMSNFTNGAVGTLQGE